MKATPRYFFILSLLAVMALTLSACGGAATPAAGSGTDASVAAVSTPECPYGKWQITNFDTYMQSVASNLNNMQSEITVSDTSTSGNAYLTFNEDGTGSFSADNFVVSYSMDFAAGGNSTSFPIVLTQNGTSTAHFTISGDQITLEDQDLGDYVVTMEMAGNTTNLDFSIFGTPGSTQLYQFSCPDTNSLSLKVIAVENMDLAPLELTRVP